jgi:hypothetical protein
MLGIGRIDRGAFITPDRRLTRVVAGELHAAAGGEIGGLRSSSVMPSAGRSGRAKMPSSPTTSSPSISRPQISLPSSRF